MARTALPETSTALKSSQAWDRGTAETPSDLDARPKKRKRVQADDSDGHAATAAGSPVQLSCKGSATSTSGPKETLKKQRRGKGVGSKKEARTGGMQVPAEPAAGAEDYFSAGHSFPSACELPPF